MQLSETWISLKEQLPPANVPVWWYDAMFDDVMYFELEDPATHDGDFTHWQPSPKRPAEYNQYFEGKPTKEQTSNRSLKDQQHRKAIKILATELETNSSYRSEWERGITTIILNELGANKVDFRTPQHMRAAEYAAKIFVQNIIDASKFELGWVNNTK